MNIYDFDKTIYDGDSTLDFYIFCLKKQPILIFYMPIQIFSFFLYLLKKKKKIEFKQDFYGFLKLVKDREEKVCLFWEINKKKIKPWYLIRQQTNDLIISASPEFLLKPICDQLNINNLIASIVDINTGHCLSENCYGEEKVNRFYKEYPDAKIQEFFSDSLTDTPMAILANNSFFVHKDQIVEWKDYEQLKRKSLFFNKEFILFIFVGIINTINGVLFSFLFSIVLDNTLAFILGYSISLLISYTLNTIYVFKNTFSIFKLLKFIVSYIPNFLVQFVMVIFLLHYIGVHQVIVYGISAIIGVPVTFLILKIFTFK
ncbi:haloacid dehalogenase-like hydrolase [Solibacillus sp. CAU 1738]|uniref:haloacid dehalogenase-like hydrolase n=1 Tax=Solibacillus sp. CAU 1738 TaxID=3140363 RepID=UPI00325FF2B9